jgi:hypothetical protein
VVITTPNGTATGTNVYNYTSTAAPTFTSIVNASGPTSGGFVVTITGTNFATGGLFGVTIGGVTATISGSPTATQIKVTTPPGTAGAQNVVITNNDGQTVTGTYTYVAVPTFTSIAPASGPITAGTRVTITGTGFTGATAVTFGGTAATVLTVNSDTQIMATVPAHAAGAVNVVVTTPGGTATGTNAFTYTPAPTFSSIAPVLGRTSGGTSVTITGGNFINGATAVTIGGITPTFTVIGTTSITATTPAHAAGAVNVVITTPGGTVTGTNAYTYGDPTITSMGGTISGAHGTTATNIQINGANYIISPVPTVTFTQGSNTMTATVTAVTAARVTVSVTIPSGQPTGAYSVTVTNVDGGTVTRANSFTIT